MAQIKLVVDSGAGLPAGMLEKHNIEVIPLQVLVDGINYIEGQILAVEVARKQREGCEIKTSAPSPGTALEVFRQIVEKEKIKDIICLTLPAHSSAVFSSIFQGAKMLLEEKVDQNIRIEVIDSYTTSMGMGLLALRLAAEIEAEASFERVVDLAKEARWHIYVCAALATTQYAHAQGRVQGILLAVNALVKLHPTIILFPKQKVTRYGRVGGHRTMQSACNALVETILESWQPGAKASVVYADTPDLAERVAGNLASRLDIPRTDIIVCEASAVLVGQAGYGAIGIAVDCGRNVTKVKSLIKTSRWIRELTKTLKETLKKE
jgi:DegV family protein with EDD domain